MKPRPSKISARVRLKCLWAALPWLLGLTLHAEVLWSDPAARLIHKSPIGVDLLGGAIKRDNSADDALYFKFRVNPLSDVGSEPYTAGLQLFLSDTPKLGLGNAPEAWAYSAFNTAETNTITGASGEFDLKSARREAGAMGTFKPYELPRQNRERTIVFKVQFIPGSHDLVTVWLDPDLTDTGGEEKQLEVLATKFKADAAFDQLRLIHDGGGNGWIFSDMAVATSFQDFVVVQFWRSWWFISLSALAVLLLVIATVRFREKRKYQRRLEKAEWERLVERERARIAQDLHDELGSSLARISLLSNLVKLDKDKPGEVAAHAENLVHSADQTVRALEEIVWAVRSGSDSLQSLIEYIAHFANEVSQEKTTRCRLDLPPNLPTRPLPPEYRHNVYLIVKEAITNAMKHAGAEEVQVRADVKDDTLHMEISDNGRGFDPAALPSETTRNGLTNMRQRAESIGGQLEIVSSPGQGTLVRLKSNFPGRKSGR
jgi:signal transduction histidine kinase